MPTPHRLRALSAIPVLSLCAGFTAFQSTTIMAQQAVLENTIAAKNQQASQKYNLPPGSLASSLNTLARQAGLTLSVDPAIIQDTMAPAVSGYYSVQQVLQQLLAGTDIQFSHSNTTVTLVKGSSKVMTLNPVKVGGTIDSNNDLPSIDTSVAVSYQALKRIQPTDLKGVFARESSVAVGGSIPLNQKLYLRGIEETALSVKIDGARQNNKVFHHSATTLIDPALLKSVRASAGISPADDGPGAIGGSIVFETVDVTDVLEADDAFGGFVNMGYDSNSKTLTTGASVYGHQQGFEALAFVNRASGDDYEDGNGDTTKYTEPDLLSGLAKVAYHAESGDRFELSYETVNDDAARPYRANFVGLTAGRPTPESRAYDLARTNIVFNYSNLADSGLWNPKLVVAKSEAELITTEIPLSDPTASTVYTGITESQSLVAENLFVVDIAEITVGIDYYGDSATFLFEGSPDIEEEVDNTGVFIQFRQSLNQLQLSYGLRYDQQDFTGSDKSEQDDSGVSANIFAEYQVSDYLTLKAGYANVWGGIALAENFILNPGWDYSAGIKSVKSKNFVVGVESTVGYFNVGANIYQTDISNGRTPSYRQGPGVVSDFDISGHDIFARYETSYNVFSLKYSNIEADKDGDPANSYDGNYFTAPLGALITISGTTSFETLPLTLSLNAEISLENKLVAEGVATKQEGYTVINVFADYQVLEDLSMRLTVNNIADENYADRATYGQEFPTIKPLFEPGRAITLSARYQF